jgi:ankyrin repeat protein
MSEGCVSERINLMSEKTAYKKLAYPSIGKKSIDAFLRLGGDPNLMENKQPLIWMCVHKRHYTACEMLIKAGANIHVVHEPTHRTPVEEAVIKGDVRLVQLLLSNGASLVPYTNIRSGCTLFHWMTESMSDVNMIELLVNKGYDINAKNRKGETPLMRVGYRQMRLWKKFIDAFVKNGADPTVVNDKGLGLGDLMREQLRRGGFPGDLDEGQAHTAGMGQEKVTRRLI